MDCAWEYKIPLILHDNCLKKESKLFISFVFYQTLSLLVCHVCDLKEMNQQYTILSQNLVHVQYLYIILSLVHIVTHVLDWII